MANNVTAVQLGGQAQVLANMNTVGDVLKKLDLKDVSVKVNGSEATAETELSDYDFVAVGEKVKGGL